MDNSTTEKEVFGFKGFDSNLCCRGFKFQVGKSYSEKGVTICEKGFHFCQNPFDVLNYYPPTGKFARVKGSNVFTRDDKSVCETIEILEEISLDVFIKEGIQNIIKNVNFKDSASTNTGNYSASTNTGNYSASTNTGDKSASTNTGDKSASTNTGDKSASTNTGDKSASIVEKPNSIAIVTGKGSKAKGGLNSWIVLTERDDDYEIVLVKAFKVDGKEILADKFYQLINQGAVLVD